MAAEFEVFREWSERYIDANIGGRDRLEAEGIRLARLRRPVMRALIIQDPQRALAVTVPAVVLQQLPASILAELETRVAGKGDYGLRIPDTDSGPGATEAAIHRVAFINQVTYTAHAYGRRAPQTAKEGASLHGIVIDGQLALHESPLRVLEPGERASAPTAEPAATCPVSGLSVSPDELTRSRGGVVEAYGRTWEFCGGETMLEHFERELLLNDDQPGPKVAAVTAGTLAAAPRAAALANSHALGTKQVLVLRVDFYDRPGASVDAVTAQQVMDGTVRPIIDAFSYGQSGIATTVSSKAYRLSRTAASYTALPPVYVIGSPTNVDALHADAVAAAASDYDAAKFDRVIVAFPYIGPNAPNGIPGSSFNFGGQALLVGGSKVVINGSFSAAVIAHELGHCYGLMHSNLWEVPDGNPLSSAGRTVEYGDPFDVMGDLNHAFQTHDTRHHFNVWHKHRIGWLPESAVITVTKTGTYRIHRFDSGDALAAKQPLALSIFRDGVRSFWIGYRRSFPNSPIIKDGASIIWGFNNLQQSQLIDVTTPGTNPLDAALAVGATLTDPASGIAIKPIAQGGSGPAQWLDVQVTMPERPTNFVTAWGAESALFFNANDGRVPDPVPETYVPTGLNDVQALAADDQMVLALKRDGTVQGWGGLFTTHVVVPEPLTDIIAIATAREVSGAVRRNGTVHMWTWAPNPRNVVTVPPGLTGVRKLAIGGGSYGQYHVLALKSDRTITAWGDNMFGQTSPPSRLDDVIAVAAADRMSFALKADGTVVHWGATYSGSGAFPSNLSGVTAIAANSVGQHLLALKADGTVVAWGSNVSGQCNVPAGLKDVVAVAAGGFHSLALKADGSIVGWGYDGDRQLDTPRTLPRAYGIAAGRRASFALTGSGAMITGQPGSKALVAGSSSTLSVSATAIGPLAYQWRKDGEPITGATSATLTLNASAGEIAYYDALVTGGGTTVATLPSRVATYSPILVTNQPASRVVELGANTTLSVTTAGGGPIRYLWRKNGHVVEGATAGTLTLSNVSFEDGGSYEATLADGATTLKTAVAQVTVAPAAHISNLSVRTTAGSGPQMLTIGFVIGRGTFGTKQVLLRAVGPALIPMGLAGALPDPQFSVFNGPVFIGGNDNWSGDPRVAAITPQVGAFPLADPQSRDAALYAFGYPASSYTVQVTGVGPASGIVVAEIYDANEAATYNASMRRLINLSARAHVGTGDAVLFAGFNIVSAVPKTVLIRGIGPTLASFGAAGVLSDPRIDVFDATATKVQENDDWGGSSGLAASFSSVGAFALDPNSKDAALLATLPPGSYTVQVSGVGGLTGAALVEIYDVP